MTPRSKRPPARRRPATKLGTFIWLILMGIAIVILVLGFTTSILPPPFPGRHREAAQPTPTQPAPGTQGLQAQAGRVFVFGNAEYKVEKTSRESELRDKTGAVTPAGSFLLVFLSVSNQGSEPLTFVPSDFSLYDKAGRKYTALREATRIASSVNQKRDIFGEALQPGISTGAVVTFDVPKDVAGLTLRLSNGYLDVNLGQ